jgi:hypothetical protein
MNERDEKTDTVLKRYNADIKRHMSALSEDFQKRVSVVAEMIGPLMEDVSIIKNNVEIIKGSLKTKVDYDEFLALEKRLSILESKIR